MVITNLRICFLKSDVDTMTYIRNNECQFIPLDYISFEFASVTLGKRMQGKQHKVKVTV